MAIQQTKKQSDLEKRLRLLRQQVYGKEPDRKLAVKSDKSNFQLPTSNLSSSTSHISPPTSDMTYLYQDLRKILVLSCLAIGIQVIIFALTKNHILNLNLF